MYRKYRIFICCYRVFNWDNLLCPWQSVCAKHSTADERFVRHVPTGRCEANEKWSCRGGRRFFARRTLGSTAVDTCHRDIPKTFFTWDFQPLKRPHNANVRRKSSRLAMSHYFRGQRKNVCIHIRVYKYKYIYLCTREFLFRNRTICKVWRIRALYWFLAKTKKSPFKSLKRCLRSKR